MTRIYSLPDGRQYFTVRAKPNPGSGFIFRADTPLKTPFDIEQFLSFLGNAKLQEIWQAHYSMENLGQFSTSPTAIRRRLKDDIHSGALRFIPSADPADQAENLELSIRQARASLQQNLNGIIQTEEREKAEIDKKFQKLSVLEQKAELAKSAVTGLGKAAKDLAVWAGDINDVISPAQRAMRLMGAAKKTYWDNNNKSFAQNSLEAEYKELVDVLGFDPSKITSAQVEDAVELSQLIWQDQETRNLIVKFVKDYVGAQHATELSEVAGRAAFDIVLTIIIGALTGGTGGALMAAKNVLFLTKLEKAGSFLLTIAKKLKRLKLRTKRNVIASKAPQAVADAPMSKYEKQDEVLRRADEKSAKRSDSDQTPNEAEKNRRLSAETDRKKISELSAQALAAKRAGDPVLERKKIAEAREILSDHVAKGDLEGLLARLDVSSPQNGAYFWSGWADGALTKAQDISAKHNGVSLESTKGGMVVNDWKELNESKISEQFWSGLSKKYAEGVVGKVEVIQSDAAFLSGGGKVWKETELPMLVKAGKADKVVLRDLNGNIRETWDQAKMAEKMLEYAGVK